MTKNILFIGEGGVSQNVRVDIPADELRRKGYNIGTTFLPYHIERQGKISDDTFDIVVFSRPHHVETMEAYKNDGSKIIVDMDDDFHAIPENHPGYKWVGLGNEKYISRLETCLEMADLVTVTQDVLKERLSKWNTNLLVIPNGYSKSLRGLTGIGKPYDTFPEINYVLGWGGTITHREDFKLAVKAIKTELRTNPRARIHIAGDPNIYYLFDYVRKESKKLFTPMLPYSLWFWLMGYWDVMLAPLVDDYFNNAKSDIKLVDAGAKGIPWVASPLPMYKDWGVGGIFAETPDEWTNAFEQLRDPTLRSKLAKEGKHKAEEEREMSVLVEKWIKAIEGM